MLHVKLLLLVNMVSLRSYMYIEVQTEHKVEHSETLNLLLKDWWYFYCMMIYIFYSC